MTLPEALYIVSQNAHGIKHNYWEVYLPAILIVNAAFPVTGYNTIEEDNHHESEIVLYRQEQNERYDFNHQQ